LAPYAVRVWSIEEKKAVQLSDFSDHKDLLAFFDSAFTAMKKHSQEDTESKVVLRVSKLVKSARQINGLIEIGEYGAESQLWDIKEKAVTHDRKITEADMLPFYFLVDLPDGVDEGVLLLQRTGLFGIRHILLDIMAPLFEKQHPQFRLHFNPLYDEGELDKYVKGQIESIRFVSFQIPSDAIEAFGGGHKETDGYAELVIHARRGGALRINDLIKKYLSSNHNPSSSISTLIALDDTNFKYSNIKIRAKSGRSHRTIDLAKAKHLRSYHDISDVVQIDPGTGQPRYNSIHGLATQLLARIHEKLYK
jgi:hypothetical protein